MLAVCLIECEDSDSEDSDDGGAGIYSYLPMDSLGSDDDDEQLDGSRESGNHSG